MKITYTKPVNTVPFKDIPVGQCFIDPDGNVCVKLYKYSSLYDVYCFTSNELFCGDNYNVLGVRPVEVELIVHAEGR